MIDAGKDFELIDVREPNEYEIVRIKGAKLIPKDRILSGEALAELPQDKPIVLHCKSGARSAEALAALHKAGFRDATHRGGGVLAWARPGDPSVPATCGDVPGRDRVATESCPAGCGSGRVAAV